MGALLILSGTILGATLMICITMVKVEEIKRGKRRRRKKPGLKVINRQDGWERVLIRKDDRN